MRNGVGDRSSPSLVGIWAVHGAHDRSVAEICASQSETKAQPKLFAESPFEIPSGYGRPRLRLMGPCPYSSFLLKSAVMGIKFVADDVHPRICPDVREKYPAPELTLEAAVSMSVHHAFLEQLVGSFSQV